MRTLQETLLDRDYEVPMISVTLDDVLREGHRVMINDDIKHLAKWMTSQHWLQKDGRYVITPPWLKKRWVESCISRIANNCGFGGAGTCGYVKMASGNIYYMYCPTDDEKYNSIVTIDCTGDDIKFSYELAEKNSAGGRITKDPDELWIGSWPGKLNDYLIKNI